MRTGWTLFALLTLALVLPACGDGSAGPGRGDEDALTQEEFAAAANGICMEAKERIVEIQGRTSDEPKDLRGGLRQASGELARAVTRLTELPRPEGEAGELARRWVEELSRRVEQAPAVIEPIVRAAEQEDPEAVKEAAQRLQSLGARGEINDLARELGVTECAE